MQVELIQDGRILRRIAFNSQDYIEAPPEGNYMIRLTNNSPSRRLAVVTVDGVNINDGKDGSYNGSGYLLNGWQAVTLKGWLRSDSEVASFEFKPNEASYAASTGRGTKNTGVIGVAVFDEKPKPVIYQPPVIIKEVHHHHHDRWPRTYPFLSHTFGSTSDEVMRGATYSSTVSNPTGEGGGEFTLCSDDGPVMAAAGAAAASAASEMSPMSDRPRGAKAASAQRGSDGKFAKSAGPSVPRSRSKSSEPTKSKSGDDSLGFMDLERERGVDLGTGYGQRMIQHTTTTTFERATQAPAFVVTLRYAVRAKLIEWGVPVPERHIVSAAPEPPNPFPAAPGYVQAPPGYRG